MVRGALREVSNPSGDRHVDELNRIRRPPRALASTTALGLTQPHLERTKLCEMGDDELEPRYVRQRAELKALVRREARAKSSLRAARIGAGGADLGACMTAVPPLATLVERPRALNEGDCSERGNVPGIRSIATRWSVTWRRTSPRWTRCDYPRRRRR